MKTIIFKTNINCSGCIKAVTPHLNQVTGLENWEVDTENPDKLLRVTTDSVSAEQVKAAVTKAGFKIEEIS